MSTQNNQDICPFEVSYKMDAAQNGGYDFTSTIIRGEPAQKTMVIAHRQQRGKTEEIDVHVTGVDGKKHVLKDPSLGITIANAIQAIHPGKFTQAEADALVRAHDLLVGSLKRDGEFDQNALPNVRKAYGEVITEGKKGL